MNQSISIRETRDNLAELVSRVFLSQEQFILTRFGKPQAMLVPINEATRLGVGAFDEVFGAWSGRKDIQDSGKWVKQLRTKTSLRVRNE